jgi:hypothetical protein
MALRYRTALRYAPERYISYAKERYPPRTFNGLIYAEERCRGADRTVQFFAII